MRYCSGSGFELLSDSDVMAVCQDSKVFLIRQLALSITRPSSKVDFMIISPGIDSLYLKRFCIVLRCEYVLFYVFRNSFLFHQCNIHAQSLQLIL